ncbi:MAG: Ig-like domain-containing protein [Deltaproteobacteria bacterium]|nr:Ig-like domain-containing protein [Deltaproteobacteria bacterium]
MNRFAIGLALAGIVGLTACGNKETGIPEDTAVTCDISVASTFPAADATGVYYRTTVEATFSEVDDTATMTVTGPDGEVAGTTMWIDETLVFTPNAPLAASTSYTMNIHFSCGDPTVSFTTSEVGTALEASALLEKTYNLDLASGRFIKPEGVGSILGQYMADTVILLGVQGSDATTINMMGAMGVDGADPAEQDACVPTIPFPVADFTANPYFEVGPETTTLTVSSYSVTIEDLFVSGAFAPDGSYIAGATLAGIIDTRPLVPLVDPEGAPGTICDLAGAMGISCEECGDGEPYCLSIEVDSMSAAQVAGLTLVQIDEVPAECEEPAAK